MISVLRNLNGVSGLADQELLDSLAQSRDSVAAADVVWWHHCHRGTLLDKDWTSLGCELKKHPNF